jgi:hypothetical protein
MPKFVFALGKSALKVTRLWRFVLKIGAKAILRLYGFGLCLGLDAK